MDSGKSLALGLILVAASGTAAMADGTFHPIERPAGYTTMRLSSMSANGMTVAGEVVNTAVGAIPYRWTLNDGVQILEPVLYGNGNGGAFAVSGDGKIVAGWAKQTIGGTNYNAMTIWNGTSPTVLLSAGSAYGINEDGSVVVGQDTQTIPSKPFRWTASGGGVDLSASAGGNKSVVSADGNTVYGGNSTSGLFRWTADKGFEDLGKLGLTSSITSRAITADGQYLVGTTTVSSNAIAFVWNEQENGGVPTLLPCLTGMTKCTANSIDEEAKTLVGTSYTYNTGAGTDGIATLWTLDSVSGQYQTQKLSDMLTASGLDLQGWTLKNAYMSSDGHTFSGTGLDGSGTAGLWYATVNVPEPASLALLSLGAIALASRRRA